MAETSPLAVPAFRSSSFNSKFNKLQQRDKLFESWYDEASLPVLTVHKQGHVRVQQVGHLFPRASLSNGMVEDEIVGVQVSKLFNCFRGSSPIGPVQFVGIVVLNCVRAHLLWIVRFELTKTSRKACLVSNRSRRARI